MKLTAIFIFLLTAFSAFAGSSNTVVSGRTANSYATIAADDTTPEVVANVLTTSANTVPTAITDLDNPVVGQTILLIGGPLGAGGASTIADGGNFNLDGKYGAMTLSLDAWILLYVQADNDYIEQGRGDNVSADAMTIGGLTMGGDINMAGYDMVGIDDVYPTVLAADTVPNVSVIKPSQDAWSRATVNTTGATERIASGLGRRFTTITSKATSAGDTLTVSIAQNGALAVTSTVITEGVAPGWECDGAASNAACALNLYTYVINNPISGVTPYCTDGTCSDAKVFFQPTGEVTDLHLAPADTGGGGVYGTATEGANGIIYVGALNKFLPGLFNYDNYTGGGINGASIDCTASGACVIAHATGNQQDVTLGLGDSTYGLGMNSGGVFTAKKAGTTILTFATSGPTIPSTLSLLWASRSKLASSADGKLSLTNAAASAGVVFNVATDSRLSVESRGGVALGEHAETLLGSQTITLNNAAAQTIYTVPAGFFLVPTKIVVRNPSAGTDATVAGGWGGDVNCTDYLAGQVFGAALDTTSSMIDERVPNNTKHLTYASATVFCYKLTVASTDADQVTMSLFGYLRSNP